MFKKKTISILLSAFMIFSTLEFSKSTVKASDYTGWQQNGPTWNYYINGNMATGWIQSNGKWYFLRDDGQMAAGIWIQSNGKWYYLNRDGDMAIGWKQIGGYWYYLNPSGVMVANKWVENYYLGASGIMVVNAVTPDGYYVDASGLWDGKPSILNNTTIAPTGITANAISSSEIQIQWNPVEGADYYYLYYSHYISEGYIPFINSDGSKKQLKWYSDYSAALTNIDPSTTVYFKITVVKNGIESGYSNIVSATTYSSTEQQPNFAAYELELSNLTNEYNNQVNYLKTEAQTRKDNITNDALMRGLSRSSYLTSALSAVDATLESDLAALKVQYDNEVIYLQQKYNIK